MNKIINEITNNIINRSQASREQYLTNLNNQNLMKARRGLACGNLAHGIASCGCNEKDALINENTQNIAIINSYNDMLSAHAPYEAYPSFIKEEVKKYNAIAQVASGVPAMCDGVTQGQTGMELSLLSRDVIAMSVAVGLSHHMFDKAIYLGVCDKIVPGLLIGALHFGHLPSIFMPAGPMTSGLSNKEKVRIRQEYAKGNLDKNALLDAEIKSYHSQGTCTFYGTANSNQLVLETLGLQLPSSSFVNPYTKEKELFNKLAIQTIAGNLPKIGEIVNEKSLVNAIVALLATGGSTNLTMHLIAIAKAAGIIINWDDFSALSKITPLIAKIYPNGSFDINDFHNAGGMSFLLSELLNAGLLHNDVQTILGFGLNKYTKQAQIVDEKIIYQEHKYQANEVITTYDKAFAQTGGITVLSGNLGRGIIKSSAINDNLKNFTAKAKVFHHQDDVITAFNANQLNEDCIVVLKYQGPIANGMPELHKLMPPLGVLLDKGFKVALLTDGRLSGASGKVPAIIHNCPETLNNEIFAKIQNDDEIEINVDKGVFNLLVNDNILQSRIVQHPNLSPNYIGFGRELFNSLRQNLTSAEEGAISF